jgi:formyl-CoA transferase
MHLSGEPEREPLRMPSYVLERIVALNAFTATLAATYEAETSGHGQAVDVSFMETVASIHEFTVPTVIFKGQAPRRVGNLALPWALVPCKDGYLGFNGVTAGNRWERLCSLLGMPELRDDPRFKDSGARNRNGHELAMLIYQWAQDKVKNEVFHRAQQAGLPLGYVQEVDEVLAMEQLRVRRFFAPVDHPAVGALEYPTLPLRYTDGVRRGHEPPRSLRRAPLLGEHTEEIFASLGCTRDDLVRLRQMGAI